MILIFKVIRNYGLPIIIVVMAFYYIFVDHSMLFKLIPMGLIICYGLLRLPKQLSRFHWLTLIGLAFCMLGDWSLQWFIIGLCSFLIGHLFYIFAFKSIKLRSVPKPFIILLTLYGATMAVCLVFALINKEQTVYVAPVLCYLIVISLMAWMSWRTGQRWLMIGSLLFVISDSILAWNMFITKVPASSLLIMSTYYGAQYCFAHFLSHQVTKQS